MQTRKSRIMSKCLVASPHGGASCDEIWRVRSHLLCTTLRKHLHIAIGLRQYFRKKNLNFAKNCNGISAIERKRADLRAVDWTGSDFLFLLSSSRYCQTRNPLPRSPSISLFRCLCLFLWMCRGRPPVVCLRLPSRVTHCSSQPGLVVGAGGRRKVSGWAGRLKVSCVEFLFVCLFGKDLEITASEKTNKQ